MLDYILNPVKMGGLIKEVDEDSVILHLHGRLGVLAVAKRLVLYNGALKPGDELSFYFSYIQIVDSVPDYDITPLLNGVENIPCLLGGTLIEVNDTAGKVEIMGNLGTIAVPRRWLFTPVPLVAGLKAEFYLSCMNLAGERALPREFMPK